MKIIEQHIIAALRTQTDFKRGNTEVEHAREIDAPGFETDLIGVVSLHGNRIAEYNRALNELYIFDAGWQTVTTKSRLNALLDEFATGYGIVQRNHQWRLTYRHEVIGQWAYSATFRAGNLIQHDGQHLAA